jgi:glyoxylase-like metal-dependent hydrolase (beta-lactamase superfamily II)
MPKLSASIIEVTPIQQNCAILCDREAGRGVVIDPGGDVDRILERIATLGITIDRILLTHGHLDHAGGAAELKERLGDGTVPVIGPDHRDQFLLESIPDQAARFGIPGLRAVTPDRYLTDGDTVDIAGVPFKVFHCPGHSPGHVIFFSEAHGLAVLGDVLFHGSIGRTDFPYGDHEALLTAIARKVLPLGDDVRFLCGHGPGSTIGAERRANPFLRGPLFERA